MEEKMNEFFESKLIQNVALNKKKIPYLDKSYGDKRRILREYSIKDEIRNYLDLLVDECVNQECGISIPDQLIHHNLEIKDIFNKIISKFNFDILNMWSMMKDFLIDGFLALEIVWDDKKQNIIALNRLRADSLVPSYEKSLGSYWIQYPEDVKLKRILLDSQIIFLSYSSPNDFSETSYIEGLIKPYNQLKIIEQSLIMYNISNATTHMKFTIPVKGLSKQKAEEQIGQLIANYSQNVEWDDTLGTIEINGSKHLPYNKQYWFPESDFGTTYMEPLPMNQPNVNTNFMESIEYFQNSLKRASKFPTKGDERQERRFNIFTLTLKSKIKEVILKPLLLQIETELPVLKNNIYLKQILINL